MRFLKLLFLSTMLFISASTYIEAADGLDAGEAASGANDNGQALFEKAEKMEWGEAGGVPDEIDAVYRQAVEKGNPYALLYLGIITDFYKDGKGEELKQAWCAKARKAAEDLKKRWRKDPEAAYQLSLWHARGMCEERDIPKSLGCLLAAASKGLPKAQTDLGKILLFTLKDGKNGLSRLTQAAEAGDARARVYLAGAYMRGLGGLSQDPKKAEKLIAEVMASKNLNARHVMATTYLEGKFGYPKDPAQARAILEELAAKNHRLAKNDLESLKQ